MWHVGTDRDPTHVLCALTGRFLAICGPEKSLSLSFFFITVTFTYIIKTFNILFFIKILRGNLKYFLYFDEKEKGGRIL